MYQFGPFSIWPPSSESGFPETCSVRIGYDRLQVPLFQKVKTKTE